MVILSLDKSRLFLSVNHPPVDFRVGRAEVLAEVLTLPLEDSLLHGEEVLVEDRVKDDRHRLGHRVDFLEDRVRVVEVDGHRDQCRDAHTPSHRSPGITDKRTTHRGVLAAMAFLQGWVMS